MDEEFQGHKEDRTFLVPQMEWVNYQKWVYKIQCERKETKGKEIFHSG